mgnify:CR=1 FL=1
MPNLTIWLTSAYMILRFKIDYRTTWGEKVCVSGGLPELGEWNSDTSPEMVLVGGETWELVLDLPYDELPSFEYKYLVKHDDGGAIWEFGKNRVFSIPTKKYEILDLLDSWRSGKELENVFLTKAFSDIVFRRSYT